VLASEQNRPYSPDLNLIEQVFAKLKHFLRKAAERTAPATWGRIGTLLDDFSPDKIALDVRQSPKDGNHQAPGAGCGVGPRLGQRAELPARIHDALDGGEQVESRAGEAVNPRHRHHVDIPRRQNETKPSLR
jgi:hypothetical protein